MKQIKIYSIQLETIEPNHIGGKDNPLSDVENPITIIGQRLCIPGPTLKGAFRSQLEIWLNHQYFHNNKWDDESLKPCIPSTPKLISQEEGELIRKNKFRSQACEFKSSSNTKRDDDRARNSKLSICPICYLLGAQGLVGFVNIPFLFSDIHYEELYSAPLDRVMHTVKKGGNRSYQIVPPGAKFTGSMEVLFEDTLLGWKLGKKRPLIEHPNADNWLENQKTGPWDQEKVLKELLIDRLQSIDRIGGYRSKGCGKVKINVSEE